MIHIHMVGIGGIGMSALAKYYLSKNYSISGSDSNNSAITNELQKKGVVFSDKHQAKNIPEKCDLLIYTEAIPKDNPERIAAKKRLIQEKTYFQALGEISKEYFTIAIAGTHGKSTTTAMLGLTLEAVEKDPNVFVGTKIFEWDNSNFRPGKSDLLIVEACEYRNSFLSLHPKIVVITSLEPEHLDFFKTADTYYESFKKFAKKADILIAEMQNPAIKMITSDFQGKKIDSEQFCSLIPNLLIPGRHNIENASKIIGVFKAMDLNIDKAISSLKQFKGTWRRFEFKGKFNNIPVYDDYAHHPTEISATLKALKEKFPISNIISVFQPHQYSRTKAFLKEFGVSFKNAEKVYIPNIYKVRDSKKDLESITPQDLVNEINKHGEKAQFSDGFENTIKILKKTLKPNDILISMGAGPVNEITEKILQ